jgi:hypothetical protein
MGHRPGKCDLFPVAAPDFEDREAVVVGDEDPVEDLDDAFETGFVFEQSVGHLI